MFVHLYNAGLLRVVRSVLMLFKPKLAGLAQLRQLGAQAVRIKVGHVHDTACLGTVGAVGKRLFALFKVCHGVHGRVPLMDLLQEQVTFMITRMHSHQDHIHQGSGVQGMQ